jgi:hypothetical protein
MLGVDQLLYSAEGRLPASIRQIINAIGPAKGTF